jgi:hypothetical protein
MCVLHAADEAYEKQQQPEEDEDTENLRVSFWDCSPAGICVCKHKPMGSVSHSVSRSHYVLLMRLRGCCSCLGCTKSHSNRIRLHGQCGCPRECM